MTDADSNYEKMNTAEKRRYWIEPARAAVVGTTQDKIEVRRRFERDEIDFFYGTYLAFILPKYTMYRLKDEYASKREEVRTWTRELYKDILGN